MLFFLYFVNEVLIIIWHVQSLYHQRILSGIGISIGIKLISLWQIELSRFDWIRFKADFLGLMNPFRFYIYTKISKVRMRMVGVYVCMIETLCQSYCNLLVCILYMCDHHIFILLWWIYNTWNVSNTHYGYDYSFHLFKKKKKLKTSLQKPGEISLKCVGQLSVVAMTFGFKIPWEVISCILQ